MVTRWVALRLVQLGIGAAAAFGYLQGALNVFFALAVVGEVLALVRLRETERSTNGAWPFLLVMSAGLLRSYSATFGLPICDGLGRACISSDLPRVAAAVAVVGLIVATVLAALDLRALARSR